MQYLDMRAENDPLLSLNQRKAVVFFRALYFTMVGDFY